MAQLVRSYSTNYYSIDARSTSLLSSQISMLQAEAATTFWLALRPSPSDEGGTAASNIASQKTSGARV